MKKYVVCRFVAPNGKMFICVRGVEDVKEWKSVPTVQGKFLDAVKEFGWSNFEKEILYTTSDRKDAMQTKAEYIKEFYQGDESLGYNILYKPSNINRKRTSPVHRSHSVETRQKMRDSHAKRRVKVHQYDLKENLLNIYDGYQDAADAVGVSAVAIAHVCNGKNKTAGGFIWKKY